jgi:hypothetical protein
MLAYREQRRQARPAGVLAAIRQAVRALASTEHEATDRAIRVLIDLGVLETAITDGVCADADALHPMLPPWRDASVAAGHILWHVRRGNTAGRRAWAKRAEQAIDRLTASALPEQVDTRVPEGYAHYGVDPAGYADAAIELYRQLRPARATCLGIRSIGTSLSAIVVAALEELGCSVLTLTVRPHGHPFDRRPSLRPDIESLLRSRVGDLFLIVDEGPGLSGSSLAGSAVALSGLGARDDQIVLLPSWRTDGAHLHSAEARSRWRRHRQFPAEVSQAWGHAAGAKVRDLSAGRWRQLTYHRTGEYPAVHPQHERRKYLVERSAGDDRRRLLRFVGLGRYGDGKLDRARDLAEAGFGPRPLGLAGGFLALEFLPGAPVRAEPLQADLLDVMARYLAHLRVTCPWREGPADGLEEVLRTNVAEGLGDHGLAALERRLGAISTDQQAPTALDARMLPHEWIRLDGGYRKADGLDHHDDHFHPGPQDIAWDVAGTCIEFGMGAEAREAFITRYRHASGDRDIAGRLPYQALSYLACRLGYAALAAQSLAGSRDGERFQAQSNRYRHLLDAELHAGDAMWHG